MLVPLHFPISIGPRVITKLGSIFQHLLSNVRAETAKRRVVVQCTPRDRVVIVAEAHKPTETHDRVGNATGGFIDDKVIDLTNVFVAHAIYFRPIKSIARDNKSPPSILR